MQNIAAAGWGPSEIAEAIENLAMADKMAREETAKLDAVLMLTGAKAGHEMNDPVEAFDLGRMFFGNEPPLFLVEIAFRTVVIYVYTLVLIRWIGSRSIAQLSLVEFLLVIALGSAVGDAMFYPDVPLVHCIVVITVVVLLDKALSYVVARSPRLEDVIEGKSAEVVRDGVINCRALEGLNFGHDELFEQLRLKDVEQSGPSACSLSGNEWLAFGLQGNPGSERPGLLDRPAVGREGAP